MTGASGADSVECRQIYWRCRRGLRELDLLLTRFVEQHWTTLSAEERASFRALLEEPDPEILGWLTGRCDPKPALVPFIARLRALGVASN